MSGIAIIAITILFMLLLRAANRYDVEIKSTTENMEIESLLLTYLRTPNKDNITYAEEIALSTQKNDFQKIDLTFIDEKIRRDGMCWRFRVIFGDKSRESVIFEKTNSQCIRGDIKGVYRTIIPSYPMPDSFNTFKYRAYLVELTTYEENNFFLGLN
ncbi:MAG: hypothetical protein QXK37_02290 [Candidatus Woesearchaeota archaeon]